ncbi:hypothetical protein MASR2M36_09940 [Providencia sp.]
MIYLVNGKLIAAHKQEEEVMSSRLKIISCHSTSTEPLGEWNGGKHQKAARQDLKSKLEPEKIQ